MASSDNSSAIASIRRFSRFYTQRVGVLNQGLLESPYSLTEVRVLYELAQRPALTATELGRDLELDAGYLSRILARFLKQKLLVRRRAAHDGRQSTLNLSARGRKVFQNLDRRSTEQIGRLIEHISPTDQPRLAQLTRQMEYLLSPRNSSERVVTIREPAPGDLGWVVQRHGALYAAEYGWDSTFEALVARIVADFGQNHLPAKERCWIAEINEVPVGCIFLVRQSEVEAKLRLLLVEPSARGAGVGRKLVEQCIRFARSVSYRKMTLWTNSILHSARHLYERAGFKLVKSESHHSFGHALVGQYWELDLV